MVRPMAQRMGPWLAKKVMAERLVAKLITLALAEARTKSMPKTRTKPKIRKLPVPGPKKPS